MLLGQDKRELGALVFPDEEHLAATGADADAQAAGTTTTSSSSSKGLGSLLFAEVSRLNKARPDYHPEDHIGHIQVSAGHRGEGQGGMVDDCHSPGAHAVLGLELKYVSLRQGISRATAASASQGGVQLTCCVVAAAYVVDMGVGGALRWCIMVVLSWLQVVRSPLSAEAGTLTRTMKPRRPIIQQVYSQEVKQLVAQLRG